jgi:hypothetical protein
MSKFRETLKRNLPVFLRDGVVELRQRLSALALEDIVLHDYDMVVDSDRRPRLSLVIPSVAPEHAFGGITTGIDIFLELGHRTGADLRFITDDFERRADRSLVDKRARAIGIDLARVEVVPRTAETPEIPVRASDIFVTYNWWTTLNVRSLLDQQMKHFDGKMLPFLYLIQDYEPLFYPFSSTHMLARLALETGRPCWGLFNSTQLHSFFEAQGHRLERTFVFEPKLSNGLRPALAQGPTAKQKRILVYGRPQIPRNCFPALEKGLRLWAEQNPEFSDWEVVSAGLPHKPVPIDATRSLRSLGKLSLEDYAELLRTTAVGLSLMSSPHPSYPPLEMAHFGIRTITNRYANKDLGTAHDNIISIPDIDAPTIAAALTDACQAFEASPESGWSGRSYLPSFLDPGPFSFLDDLTADLLEVWNGSTKSRTAVLAGDIDQHA